jgi:tripartite-type tricarboxylate transporter receptor subunit TctC
MAQAGLPDVDTHLWSGIFAPAGTPQPIVDKLIAELGRALADTGVQDKLKAMAVTPGGPSGKEFARYIENDIQSFSAVVKAAKLTFQ